MPTITWPFAILARSGLEASPPSTRTCATTGADHASSREPTRAPLAS
jgi:hypothetical protein